MLVSCTDPDQEGDGYYYNALFDGNNELMSFALQFDPILLSCPSWDEKLWNGEVKDGWQIDCPQKWPIDISKDIGCLLYTSLEFFNLHFSPSFLPSHS